MPRAPATVPEQPAAATAAAAAAAAAVPPPPETGSGKFHYPDGSTYEGEFRIINQVPLAPEGPRKGSAKPKKEDEAAAAPAEPPKRVRHGKGVARSPVTHTNIACSITFVKDGLLWNAHAHTGSSMLLLFTSFLLPHQAPPTSPSSVPLTRFGTTNTFTRHHTGVWTSGSYRYEGDWVEDAMQGQGRFDFASGASYNGSWEDNKYEGQGTYTWPGGKRYEVRWPGVLHRCTDHDVRLRG